jgi:hypothetical protein
VYVKDTIFKQSAIKDAMKGARFKTAALHKRIKFEPREL